MKHKVIWEDKGIYIIYCDSITGSDFLQEQESRYSDPRFDNMRYTLSDFTNVKDINVTLEDISKHAAIAKAAALSNSRMKIAIVACEETQLAFISWYITETEESPWASKIFATVDEAREWVSE